MNTPSPRFQEFFFSLYEGLPRQGTGNRACAARALALCAELGPAPAIIDLGCGVGGQTWHLAELTVGTITAIDSHAPSIERMRQGIAQRGLAQRITALVGDMAAPPVAPPGGFDLVWSEGALYSVGLAQALAVCHALLRPGGYLAFTDAVWRSDVPPAEVRAGFEADYPTMGRVDDNLAAIRAAGFRLADHFPLPDAAWWDDFYTPMTQRINVLRQQHAGDAEAAAILDQLAKEPELHRRFGHHYAYEFFVARKAPAGGAGGD